MSDKLLAFVHEDTVYVSESFAFLKDRCLELGAHRRGGKGQDLTKIILPVTPTLLEAFMADFTLVSLPQPETFGQPIEVGMEQGPPEEDTPWIGSDANDPRWIGADDEDPAIDAAPDPQALAEVSAGRPLSAEEIYSYCAESSDWADSPWPAGHMVFFCPTPERSEDATRILFRKVVATVTSGRSLRISPANNPTLTHRCFYVETDA